LRSGAIGASVDAESGPDPAAPDRALMALIHTGVLRYLGEIDVLG
jgi:hypothetical protein